MVSSINFVSGWRMLLLALVAAALPGAAGGQESAPSAAPKARLEYVGSVGEPIYGCIERERTALLAQGFMFRIVDRADPRRPVVLSQLRLDDTIYSMASSQDAVYLSLKGGKLLIVDVSDPARPQVQSWMEIYGSHTVLNVEDKTLIARTLLNDVVIGVKAYHLADPLKPFRQSLPEAERLRLQEDPLINLYALTPEGGRRVPESLEGMLTIPSAVDLQVAGSRAYVIGRERGFYIFDVSEPRAPRLSGMLAVGTNARRLAVGGTLALIAEDEPLLHVIDISRPEAPVLRCSFALAHSANAVVLDGRKATLADATGLTVLDLSDPAAPKVLSQVPTPRPCTDLIAEPPRAYVCTDQLWMFDLRRPEWPVLIGSLEDRTERIQKSPKTILGLRTDSTHGYLYDVTDPTRPLKQPGLLRCENAERVLCGALTDQVAYLAWSVHTGDGLMSALDLFDHTDPEHPELLGDFRAVGRPEAMVAAGDLLYVADGGFGLAIFRLVRNPQDEGDAPEGFQ